MKGPGRRYTVQRMKRTTLTRAFLLGLTAAASACTSSNEAGPSHPVDPAALYGQMCARCHGLDGRGDAEMRKTMPTLRDFADPELRKKSVEDLEGVIMAGKNPMPGFGASLSRPKIQHLGGYVRRLALAANPTGEPIKPAHP
jgi:mono/diheme cytochrome c family protein